MAELNSPVLLAQRICLECGSVNVPAFRIGKRAKKIACHACGADTIIRPTTRIPVEFANNGEPPESSAISKEQIWENFMVLLLSDKSDDEILAEKDGAMWMEKIRERRREQYKLQTSQPKPTTSLKQSSESSLKSRPSQRPDGLD